ncbi:MAG: hypothetical protein OEY01_05380, partial [Desulfobulbaceae bacterium]|nr:hypothetical protein [Desulfobulbaceae bacterium]
AAKAAAVVREESADAELVKSWQEHIKTLRDGDQILRHNLAIEVLTPFVKEMSQRKAGLVGSGYEIFRMFKDDGQDKNKESLAGFQLQAIDLEKRLGNIDLAGFTGLALDIIKKQIKVALVTTDRIKSFVEDFRKNPPKEIGAIDQIEENLIAMRVAPANAILAEIEKLSESLAHNLIRLNSKTASMKCFVLLPVLLNEATLLQKTMRNSVVPELKMHITSPGSPLNPQTIAAEMAEVFFMGLKGFWRLIKLFFYSAGGQHPINSVELQKIIIETICSCKSFYGNTKEDVAALKTFIDYQLGEFTRPFPYEDLLQILKTAIATYGSRFEKKLFAFEVIDFEDASPTDKTTLGNLIAVIKKHSATLS